jgi:hypothetical protein
MFKPQIKNNSCKLKSQPIKKFDRMNIGIANYLIFEI